MTKQNQLVATLTIIASCSPDVPASALQRIAKEALKEAYPHDFASFIESTEKILEEVGVNKALNPSPESDVNDAMHHYLKCDAEGCDYLEEHPEITWDMVGKPCPKCGANLLTQADADNYPYMSGERPYNHCPFHPDYEGKNELKPSDPCPVCGVSGTAKDWDRINEKCVDKG